MSHEVIVKNSGSLKHRLLALTATAVVVLLVMTPMLRTLHQRAGTGMMTEIGVAILTPLLIWLLYPQMMKLLPGGKNTTTVLHWSIQNGVLTLGEAQIPLHTIKMVHCWQNGDAWTINIETTGRNCLLRSAEEEPRSVRQLYALVDALGYRGQWKER